MWLEEGDVLLPKGIGVCVCENQKYARFLFNKTELTINIY